MFDFRLEQFLRFPCRWTLRSYIIVESRESGEGDAFATFRDNLLKLQLRDRDFRVRGASLLPVKLDGVNHMAGHGSMQGERPVGAIAHKIESNRLSFYYEVTAKVTFEPSKIIFPDFMCREIFETTNLRPIAFHYRQLPNTNILIFIHDWDSAATDYFGSPIIPVFFFFENFIFFITRCNERPIFRKYDEI